MALISLASSQPADESSKLSGGLTHLVFGTLWGWFSPEGQEMSVQLFETFEFVVRKGAHIVAFFVLGFCTANTVRQLSSNRRRVFWIALLWGSAYGALDEFHQTFVPGRAGMWQDWLLDTIGALLGVWVVLRFVWRKKEQNS